jgi:hypothetical protein
MHWQVHRTDVVPELAGRRSMILVARSKKIMTSQLYVSLISHVAEEIRRRAMVGEWSKQSSSITEGMVDESPSRMRRGR